MAGNHPAESDNPVGFQCRIPADWTAEPAEQGEIPKIADGQTDQSDAGSVKRSI